MDESHHFLSGFKSLFTDWAYHAIEESRISCGGAGYTKWAAFAEHHNFYSPMQTFEGDNTVMLQQSSRYLFKLIKKHQKGKKVESPFEYIAEIDSVLSDKFVCLGSSREHFLNLKHLDEAFKVKACYMIKQVFTAYTESKEPEKERANEIFA